jgi:hypothetical protein
MAEKPDNPGPITLTLSDRHIRQMIKHHDLSEADAQDIGKVSAIAQRLFDETLGLPEEAWHDWDGWAAGLE